MKLHIKGVSARHPLQTHRVLCFRENINSNRVEGDILPQPSSAWSNSWISSIIKLRVDDVVSTHIGIALLPSFHERLIKSLWALLVVSWPNALHHRRDGRCINAPCVHLNTRHFSNKLANYSNNAQTLYSYWPPSSGAKASFVHLWVLPSSLSHLHIACLRNIFTNYARYGKSFLEFSVAH